MYPVSQEFIDKIKADERQVFAKLQVDYTSPFLDQSISVEANETANASFPSQTADSVAEPFAKIASLDGSWVLDGTYALAPATTEEAETKQMGWWGKQLAGTGGAFSAPYPTLTVSFFPRPITKLQAVGDSKREEWPVDFNIKLYDGNNTLLHTETVTGNTEIAWSKVLDEPITQVEKMTLEITKWSHAGRHAKILEFFTSIQEVYEGDDIILVHLLEEREVSQGSLPVGNISANEIDIRLNNETRKFDAGNKQSPLYQTLKANRRIKAWLGVDTAEGKEYVPLGTFWSGDWNVPEDEVYAQTTGRDRLELLRKSTYSVSKVLPEAKELPSPTFTRASEAYLSDGTKVAANQPRFEAGEFGQAVLVEEGTTNLENSWDGWLKNPGSTLTQISAYEYQFTGGFTSGAFLYKFFNYSGKTITFQVEIKGEGDAIGKRARWQSTGIGYYSESVTLTNEYQKLVGTVQFLSDNVAMGISLIEGILSSDVVYLRFKQLEQKPYPTSFTDNTRAVEELRIPTAGVLDPTEGTISFFVNPNIVTSWNNFCSTSVTNGRFLLYFDKNGDAKFDYGTSNQGVHAPNTIKEGVWQHIAIRWSASTNKQAIFVNGVKYEKDLTNGVSDSFSSNMNVVVNYSALIDDLRISSIARTDEEIMQDYASGKPAVWDEDTAYLLRFDGDLQTAQQTATLHGLAKNILTDAELTPEEYWLDPELKLFPVPYAWFDSQSHREALRKVAEACLGQVYCDRNGIIRIEGPAFLQSQTEPVMTITQDDYFRKDNPVKWSEIANYVEVETQPLRPDIAQEVYRSNEPVPITAGQTKTITAYYNHTPCIEATATLENAVSGAEITKATYYAWGANITVSSSNTGTFELVINAKPLKVLNKEKAIAKDDASITDNGMLKYTFPANPLVQTREVAQKIADTLLAYYKDPRRDVEVEWRGNPALLLGDRVAVVDKDEENEYFVTRQELEYTGALRAHMSGRRA